jgi:hypothetical protein
MPFTFKLRNLFGKRDKAAPQVTVAAPSHIPIVKLDQSRVTTAVEAEIKSTLRDVPEIGAGELASAYGAALQSVRAGRDLKILHDALIGLGLTKRRASEVAILVNNRATSLMNREQQASLGITKAVWLYSGAPCITSSGTPSLEDERRNTDHLAANGKSYVIVKGMLMSGRRVWPGQDPGCKCVSKSVIPGFD